jgi:hypothetical protein
MDSLTVSASAKLTFAGDVTIVLPRPNVKSLRVIEGGGIKLAEGATVRIFTAGDIEISGDGFFNQIPPEQLQIWGTSTTSQEFLLSGSGRINGIIYAPNANLTMPGGTKFHGAVVANNIMMSGSGSFHYDESLKDFAGMSGAKGPLTVQHVRELETAEDRAPYLTLMGY